MSDSTGPVSPDLRETIAEVFAEALERAPADRARFLTAACRGRPGVKVEVESLLAAHDECEHFLEHAHPTGVAEESDEAEEPARSGERLGPYRVLHRIGRGGTGTVYLGERADAEFGQRVALKLLRDAAGSRLLVRRFLRERHILARLDHPNIARLLDAGSTGDGRPYLAMEYVEGVPLTAYCDERGLGIEARLRVFMEVCAAVQYAHQSLVVHRDLKPANILVKVDGHVKLLDFGIAKLLTPEVDAGPSTLTELGFRAMTPEYAAPEQVRGEPITTAADVYALGAVLYELLSGRRPHRFRERTLEEIARIVGEEDPHPPSTIESAADRQPATTPAGIAAARGTTPDRLRRRLAGDLDAIVLTALRREPERRYGSAEALREDIRRHLARLPVAARRDSVWYRTGRFVRRNRMATVTGALAVVSLAGGLAGTAWQAREAARERDAALREADKAARVSSFMAELFFLADPGQARGENVTVREAIDSGRVWIDRELAGQPELRLEMAYQLGEVYYRLGLYREAREMWEVALAAGITDGGEIHEPVLKVMLVLIKALEDLGRLDSAEVFARRALAIQQRLPQLRSDAFATTHVLARLANVLRLQGRLGEADSVIQGALAILPAGHPDAPHRRTVLLTTLAHVRRAGGDPAGAEALLRGILEVRHATWGDEHPEVAQVFVNLGAAIGDQERYAEAESLALRGLDMQRRLLGESHPDVALGLASLAEVLRGKGDAAAAAELYRRALALARRTLPPDHPRLAEIERALAGAEQND